MQAIDRNPTIPRVIIVGGGLAGMAAAVALESAGIAVTLLEARQGLGGRAGSFQDQQTGEELDNCQHVLLGCCTNLVDFYRRLGVGRLIRFERTIHFTDAGARRYELTGTPGVPAPFHLGFSMARFGALSLDERAAVARAMIVMMRIGAEGRAKLCDVAFGDWLDEYRQPSAAVEKLYDPVLTGSLNEECRRASAAAAIHVFQDALLNHSAGYVLGLPDCPLGQLYAPLPCRDVRLGTRVSELVFDGMRVSAVRLQDGSVLGADTVVLATNYHAVQRWVTAERARADARFRNLDRLQSVPILGAHIWFDRPVMTLSHTALLTGPLQWVFRKDREGRAVHGVISAARDWVNRPKEECLRLFEAQLRELLPAAREARLVRGVIVVEKRATFSPSPGVDAWRPAQGAPEGGLRNLFLAGDYTQTGWPATMEGAVRSGYLAAEAVMKNLDQRHTKRSFLVADLPPQWPARLLRQS